MASFATHCAAACIALVAQPGFAAEDFVDRAAQPWRAAPYAGLTLRTTLGERQAPRPVARFQFGMRHIDSAGPRLSRTPGFVEFGARQVGGPGFFVGGQETVDIGQRLGLSTAGTVLVVLGVVALVGVVVVAAAGPSEDDCFFDCQPF